MKVECGNCMWYVPIEKTGGQGGECHLNPPSVVITKGPTVGNPRGGEQTINTVFPPVPKSSWCARFAPQENFE